MSPAIEVLKILLTKTKSNCNYLLLNILAGAQIFVAF